MIIFLGEQNEFELKIEIIGNHGLMRSATYLMFYDTILGDVIHKCSGRYDDVFGKVQ